MLATIHKENILFMAIKYFIPSLTYTSYNIARMFAVLQSGKQSTAVATSYSVRDT